jgi:hypothetical protein
MKNIYIISTDKPSRLSLSKKGLFLQKHIYQNEISKSFGLKNQHIYITNDEIISSGEWCIDKGDIVHKFVKFMNYNHYKKIILTTDQDLIKDGVQAIDDEFLEWFVKNPSCEEIKTKLVKFEVDMGLGDSCIEYGSYYEIIIPKPTQQTIDEDFNGGLTMGQIIPQEEPKQECEHIKEYGCIKDICSCNTNPKKAPLKHKVQSIPKEEILANRSNAYEFIDFDKQETLEEVAENYVDNFEYGIAHPRRVCKNAFINGAKWQMDKQDDFSIGFGEWLMKKGRYNITNWSKTTEELLETYKNTLPR